MFPPSILFATVLCLSASFSLISATLVNVTVDDSQTNEGALVIQYTPVDTWNDGPNCPACTAHPNPENTMNETWHDSTHQSGAGEDGLSFATLEFDGVAVYVYCVIAHTSISPDGNTDMTFVIDGETVGSFVLAPTNQTTYDYNVLVHSSTGLSSGPHTFTLQNGRVGGAKSLVLLDYIVYTRDDELPPPPPPVSPPFTPSSSPSPTQQITTPSLIPLAQTSSTPGVTPSSSTLLPSVLRTGELGTTVPIVLSSPSGGNVAALPSTSGMTITGTGAATYSLSSTTVPELASSSASAGNPAFAATSAHAISSKTRTIVIGSVVPGGVMLLIAAMALALWCRRRRNRYVYTPPPERDIGEDPGSSGWAEDAWKTNVATPSSHGHGEATALTSTLYSSAPSKSVGKSSVKGGTDTIGRARGLTTSSAVTAASARSNASEYSQGSTRDYHASEPSSSGLSYVTAEPVTRTRHPYAARTPEPFEGPDEPMFGLPTVLEMPTPAPSSSASHSQSHERAPPTPAPEPPSAEEDTPGPSRVARPLPLRPMVEGSAHAARNRRIFRTPSGSSELPPSYEDISGEFRDSLRSINDVKL